MPDPYATPAQLAEYLSGGDAATVPDADRLLARATELVDATVRAPYDIDDTTGLPTDDTTAAALRDATCAQVEYWVHLGEEHDIEGMAGRQVTIGHLSIGALPDELAPRARRLIANAGLLSLTPRRCTA